MKRKLFHFTLLVLLSSFSLNATAAGINDVAKFIRDLQYTEDAGDAAGAFRKSYGNAYNSKAGSVDLANNTIPVNTKMYMVEPYFNHFACIALVEIGGEENLTAVKKWMTWYINHASVYNPINFEGDGYKSTPPLTMNHYYDINGNYHTTCPTEMGKDAGTYCNQIDAEDSDATLFYILLNKYIDKTNDIDWLKGKDKNNISIQLKLEGLMGLIVQKLWTNKHLTDAKRIYNVQYTMDNSEVYAGIAAFAAIEEKVYKNVYGGASNTYPAGSSSFMDHVMYATATWRPAIRAAFITEKLYPLDKKPGGYMDFKLAAEGSCNGFLTAKTMYDFTPMFWPVIFGLETSFDSEAAQYTRNVVNKAMAGWTESNWTKSVASNTFWETSVGYFFSKSSKEEDKALGKKQVESALPHFIPGNSDPGYIADGAWLIFNMLTIEGKDITLYIK